MQIKKSNIIMFYSFSLTIIITFLLFSCKKEENSNIKNQITEPEIIDKRINAINFSSSIKSIGQPGNGITDIEGNVYKTVIIENQEWMAENLKVTKYNDGTDIKIERNSINWSTNNQPTYCFFNNDSTYISKYGIFYNWYVIKEDENMNKNICPTGWHVPSEKEWNILINYLGGETVAGGKLKEIQLSSWNQTSESTTNTSLFTALPSGYRNNGGNFGSIGNYGYWWTSTELNSIDAYYKGLYSNSESISTSNSNKKLGLSIRCIKD
jgi:uncharacterized protein (TIGR02145 family)